MRLVATEPLKNGKFGHKLALLEGGGGVAVGTPRHSGSQTPVLRHAGSVYQYEITANNTAGSPTQLTARTPEPHQWFGWSVVAQGKHLYVGAPHSSGMLNKKRRLPECGAVFAFPIGSGGQADVSSDPVVLTAPGKPTARAAFGYSLAATDATIFVGCPGCNAGKHQQAGVVYAYQASDPNQPPKTLQSTAPKKNSHFGIKLFANDLILAVPDQRHQDKQHKGAVIIFPTDGAAVTLQSPTQHDYRGCRPQVQMEGRPRSAGSICDAFGHTMLLEGDSVIVADPYEKVSGASMAGAVYRWKQSTMETERVTAPEPQPYALFGKSLTTHNDKLIVGSPRSSANEITAAGSVLLYSLANVSEAPAVIVSHKPVKFGQFGDSIAAGGDGMLAIGGGSSAAELFNTSRGYTSSGVLGGFSPVETPQMWLFGNNLALSDQHELAVLQPAVKLFDFEAATADVVKIGAITDPNVTKNFLHCDGVLSNPSLARMMSGWALTDGLSATQRKSVELQCVPATQDGAPANFTGSADFEVKLSFSKRVQQQGSESVMVHQICVQPMGAATENTTTITDACCAQNLPN